MKKNVTEHSHHSLLTRMCACAGSVTLLSGTITLLGAPAYAATTPAQVAQTPAVTSTPSVSLLSRLSQSKDSSVVGWDEKGYREGGIKRFNTASLSLNKQDNGNNVEGVTFTLTKVPFIDVHNTSEKTLKEIKGLTVDKAEENLKNFSEEPLTFSATTGRDGNVKFNDIPVGVYIVEEEKDGNAENKELIILPNYNVNNEQWEDRGIIAWKSTHKFHPPVWPDWDGSEKDPDGETTPPSRPNETPEKDTDKGTEKTPDGSSEDTDKGGNTDKDGSTDRTSEITENPTESTTTDTPQKEEKEDGSSTFVDKFFNDPNLATTGFPILGLLLCLGLISASALVLYFQVKKEKSKESK